MLQALSIRNIVLIESCEIALKSGLCVLSGETGAGKSILLDALGLALGARADAGLIRAGEAQGTVAAEFDIAQNEGAKAVLREFELEDSDSLLIRRSIGADGKTRAHVNDQPVTVAALKKIGEALVEIHGQHDQRSLMDTSLHRDMLDDYAALGAWRKAVFAAWGEWKAQRDALAGLRAEIEQGAREQEYLRHIQKELSELAPEPGEEESLASQRTAMMQSEKLFEVLNAAIAELNAGKGISLALRSAERMLSRSPLTSGEAFAPARESLDKAAIEAEEALAALEKIGRDSQYDPDKLERIEERLFALRAAGRKYNLPVEELPNLLAEAEAKLALVKSQEHRIAELEKKVSVARETFVAAAEKLSASRKKAAARLDKAVASELAPLMMEGSRFRVRVEPLDEASWAAHGMDAVHFECATNVAKGAKEVTYAPLSKIASGGELSRFMLALKVALQNERGAATLIFDEIDAGTGGAVADAIGQRLARLGRLSQVLVVTHLPQVAARGGQHLLVSKRAQGKKVVTEIADLAAAAREEELARMLSGASITKEARKAAQKLLEEAA